MKILYLLSVLFLFLSQSIRAQEIEYLTPKLIDLGSVKERQVIKGDIRFVNKGDASLTILGVSTSCGCTAAHLEKRKFASGDTVKISYTLNTQTFQGMIRKPLIVSMDINGHQNAKFIIQADVYGDLTVNPRYIHITSVEMNLDTVITNFVTIQNQSDNPIHIKKIQTSNTLIQVSPQSALIPSGKEHLVRVELRPTNSIRKAIYIMIETDCTSKSRINIPIYVNIKE